MRCALMAAALVVLAGCANEGGGSDHSSRMSRPTWRYVLRLRADSGELSLSAELPASVPLELSVAAGAEPFVSEVELATEGGWMSLPERDDSWWLPPAPDGGARRLRWRFDLAGAARAIRARRIAWGRGGAWLSPPSTWLLHPLRGEGRSSVRLRVEAEGGAGYASGVLRAAGDESVYEFEARRFAGLPYTAIGSFRRHRIEAGGATIDIAILPGRLTVDEHGLVAEIEKAARAVASYLGSFPVPHAIVVVEPRRRARGYATALGNGGASIHYPVHPRTTLDDVRRGWVLVHEMLHFAFPQLAQKHHWFEEGCATYLEPLVRLRAGIITKDRFWRELIRDLPQGLPEAGDAGLDNTHTWGRVYWGGALFCLLADVEIRRRTATGKGFVDAIGAVVRAGGDISTSWTFVRALETADRGLGVDVMLPLYHAMKDAPHPVDLDDLWRRLGVALDGDRVVYDEAAPLASVREAMTR